MPKNETGEFLGHAVANGQVRFWSVSALEKGDPRSGGCPRRWAYKYVFGRKEPQNEHAAAGDKLHDEIKRYERGQLPREQMSGELLHALHIIPDPGPDLMAEAPLHHSRQVVPGAPWLIDWAPLTAAGIPVIGFMDLQHGRGTNKGTEDVAEAYDPPGTVEVIDWKRKGSAKALDYILEPRQLLETIQMSGYAVHVTRAWQGVQHIRLSHGYVIAPPGKQPRAKKVSLRILPEQALRAWEYAEGVARTLVDVAKERDVHRVPANLDACDRFGGCPHRGECRAARTETLAAALGEAGAASIVNQLTSPGGMIMGLVTNALGGPIPPAPAQPAAPQPQMVAPPAYAPPPQPPAAPQHAAPQYAAPAAPQLPAQYAPPQAAPAPQMTPAPAVAATVDMRAQLEAEERALAQANAANQVPPDFAEAVKVVETSGRGFPMLQGRAAQLRASLAGMMLPPGAALSGAGELGQKLAPVEDPAQLIAFARDMMQAQTTQAPGYALPQGYSAPPAQAPMQQAAPQAPAASQYAAPAPMQTAVPVQPITPGPGPYAGTLLPPGAPATNPAALAAAAQAAANAPAEAPKAKRSRKPKASEAAPVAQPAAGYPQPSAAQGFPPHQPSVGQIPTAAAGAADDLGSASELEIFVDCLPLGDYQSLRGYVDHICAALAAKYCVDATGQRGLQDIRIAPKDSPLGFGGWKGVLAATVRELPPQAGTWVLDTRGSEINEVVADALASVCEARGHLYARGIK